METENQPTNDLPNPIPQKQSRRKKTQPAAETATSASNDETEAGNQDDTVFIIQKDKYDQYLKYREEQLNLLKSNQDKLDSQLLTLSSAFLAASIAFIKDIFPLEKSINTSSLVISWIFFVLTIISVICSLSPSKSDTYKAIDDYYDSIKSQEEIAYKPNIWHKITCWLNQVSFVSFLLALIFLLWFVSTNLSNRRPNINNVHKSSDHKENESKMSEKIEKGLSTTPPPKPQTPNLTPRDASPQRSPQIGVPSTPPPKAPPPPPPPKK